MCATAAPRQNPSVVLHALGAEAMLYDPQGDRVVRLNWTARRIWELCSGTRTVDEIAAVLQNEAAVAPGTDLRADVAATVAQFADCGLLTGTR
jgi:hypothetical protein